MASQKATLQVQGMSCQHCVQTVKTALSAVPGVTQVEVTLQPGAAAVTFDPVAAGLPKLMDAVKQAGFTPTGFKVAP